MINTPARLLKLTSHSESYHIIYFPSVDPHRITKFEWIWNKSHLGNQRIKPIQKLSQGPIKYLRFQYNEAFSIVKYNKMVLYVKTLLGYVWHRKYFTAL